MKHKFLIPAALVLSLILGASVGSAMAYFTTYASAEGGYTIALPGSKTDVDENFSGWQKRVVISSAEGSMPVFVRAQAFSGSAYTLTYSGEGWTPGSDGYYYYTPILEGGAETAELLVNIGNVPQDVKPGDSFNVIVVYETTPVLYDEAGTAYADWSVTLDRGGN